MPHCLTSELHRELALKFAVEVFAFDKAFYCPPPPAHCRRWRCRLSETPSATGPRPWPKLLLFLKSRTMSHTARSRPLRRRCWPQAFYGQRLGGVYLTLLHALTASVSASFLLTTYRCCSTSVSIAYSGPKTNPTVLDEIAGVRPAALGTAAFLLQRDSACIAMAVCGPWGWGKASTCQQSNCMKGIILLRNYMSCSHSHPAASDLHFNRPCKSVQCPPCMRACLPEATLLDQDPSLAALYATQEGIPVYSSCMSLCSQAS